MKRELIKLANHLDKIGHRDLADTLDKILKNDLSKQAAGGRPDYVTDMYGFTYDMTDYPNNITVIDAPSAREDWVGKRVSKGRTLWASAESSGETDPSVIAKIQGGDDDAPEESQRASVGEEEEESDFSILSPSTWFNAEDGVLASNEASERIDKMASLISGEFSSGVPNAFKR
jgi:hypothetical protein